MNSVIKFAITMLVLDFFYLTSFSKDYNVMMLIIQKAPLAMKPMYAVLVYILLIAGWYLLIYKQPIKNKIIWSIVLGVIIYGVFDFTNLAIFNDYSLRLALIDTLWGGILFGISSAIAMGIKN